MASTLTLKGQVTIPRHIRDELQLEPGSQVEFSVNANGEVIIRKAGTRASPEVDRYELVRGRASFKWRTDELMALLRGPG